MVALRLVRLIEKHSEEIANTLLQKFRNSSHTRGMRAVPEIQLLAGVRDFLRHISEWLLTKTDSEIEHRSRRLGTELARLHVALADGCWSIVIIKQCLWDFLQREGYLAGPIELYGELELLCLLNQVFDHAVCHFIEGYEAEMRKDMNVAAKYVHREAQVMSP